MNTNVLITSAGKRVSLLKFFQNSLKKIFPDATVFTADVNPSMAPACIVSENYFKVPRATDESYITALIEICKANGIGLIIPTIDTELVILAQNKELLNVHGIKAVISDYEFITKCCDKRDTPQLFASIGIATPAQRDKENLSFPLFAKPYDGSCTKGTYVIKSADDLSPSILNNPKLIFQKYIDKREFKEFTVDMYFGRDNRLKSIVPRERVEIRDGEINKGYTRKNHLVPFLKQRMEQMPGVVGCICMQLFFNESTHEVLGIEINPRFGGGYPLSYHAGADYPSYIIREYLLNEEITYNDDWHDNTLLLRYDQDVIVMGK